jgi:hypothetical protein
MIRNLLRLAVAGCVLTAASGCQTGRPPETAAARSGPLPTVRAPDPPPAAPKEPALPEPRRLSELFPADALKLLASRKVSAEEFADFVFVPGSVVRTGGTATARVRRRSEGSCFVRYTPTQGWSAWARLAPGLNLEKTRLPLRGVPAEVRSAEELTRYLCESPGRVLDLKATTGGAEVGLLGLAGVRVDLGDLVRLEAAAEAAPGYPGVSRLTLTALGRELPVVVAVARRDGRWEVTELRQVAGLPVTRFLERVLPPPGSE